MRLDLWKTTGSVVVDFLFIVTPIVGVCNCSMFCCTLLYVHSSIAIILTGKRELIALLNLSSWCLVMVEQLFLAVPRGCLQFVIEVFPDHTHLLFLFLATGRIFKVYAYGQSFSRHENCRQKLISVNFSRTSIAYMLRIIKSNLARNSMFFIHLANPQIRK